MSSTEPRLTRASSRGATPAASPRKQAAMTPRKVGSNVGPRRSGCKHQHAARVLLPPGCRHLVPAARKFARCEPEPCLVAASFAAHGLHTLCYLQVTRQLSATPGPSGGTPGARGTPFAGSAIRRQAEWEGVAPCVMSGLHVCMFYWPCSMLIWPPSLIAPNTAAPAAVSRRRAPASAPAPGPPPRASHPPLAAPPPARCWARTGPRCWTSCCRLGCPARASRSGHRWVPPAAHPPPAPATTFACTSACGRPAGARRPPACCPAWTFWEARRWCWRRRAGPTPSPPPLTVSRLAVYLCCLPVLGGQCLALGLPFIFPRVLMLRAVLSCCWWLPTPPGCGEVW